MKNVHFAIPEIYGETLSYYELLRKLVDKTNELIDNYNTVPEQIAEEVKNLDASQLFSTVLNQLIHSIATDNTKSANAVMVYKKHDLLYATFNETVNLYESLIDFTAGTETELIVGTNIREVNISELFIELRKLIDINKNNIEAVTAVANENSTAITTMRNDITDIENKNTEQDNELSTLRTMRNDITDIKNKNTEQDNELSTLRTMISSPYNFKGDVASISALPASGAVNDTYYVQDVKYKVTWTGSAWMQSSLSEADYQTELNELKGDLVEYTNANGIVYIPTNVTEYNNKYIDDYGVLQTLSNYKVISNIELKKDEVITVETYSENHASIISKVDNGTYVPLVKATDTGYKKADYTADEDCVIAISVRYTNNYLYYLTKANVKNIENKTNECFCALSNSYKNINGELKGSTQAQKSKTNKVVLAVASAKYNVYEAPITENDYIRVDCQVGPNTSYAVGFFCCDDDYNILYQFNYPIDTRLQYEFVAPKGSKKIIVNGYNFIPYAKEIIKVAPPITYTSLSLFERFGVIGDSFASGELYYSGDYHDKYNISWGQILARKLGTTCTNYSRGGLTTRSWLTAEKGLPLVLSNPAEDIYYCALGINDVYSLGIDYLGSIADITDFDSYVDYRDTFYGNYGRIIEQVQNHAPHSKIVLFTCANNSGNYELFNNAIIEIANHYNIPYIVQSDDPFFNTDIYLKMEGRHPTAIGYSGMAEAFERLLNKCIVDNLNYFKNTFMYNNQ